MTTLDDMLIETAIYCDVSISKVNGTYTGESLVTVSKLKSALNYAYKKICLEKIHLEYKEALTDTSYCTKKFYKAIALETEDCVSVDFTIEVNQIKYDYDGTVYLRYAYIPEELDALTDVTELPPNVDLRILCYYAAWFYLSDDEDSRADKFINLFNDGFDSLNSDKKVQKTVKNGWGW